MADSNMADTKATNHGQKRKIELTVEAIEKQKLTQKFNKTASAEEKAKYKLECRTDEERTQYRAEWDARKLTNIKGTQGSKTSDKQADVSEGWYKPFAMVMIDQGALVDKEGATVRAVNICTKCESLGPPFVMYNKFSKAIEYLDTKRGSRSSFETSTNKEVSGAYSIVIVTMIFVYT